MAVLTRMLVAVLVGVAAVQGVVTLPGQSPRASDGACSTIRLLSEKLSVVEERVLQELCKAGWRHVLLERARQNERQFAVVYLHRDDFSEMVQWHTGDAQDVTADADWWVDEEVAIPAGQGSNAAGSTSNYHWYRHGLPLWPLPNQALAKTTRKFSCLPFCRSRSSDWPNYAFATPLFLVPYEKRNYRNPEFSIGKRFSETENLKNKCFVKTPAFFKFVRSFVSSTGDRILQHPESPRNWLTPLLNLSLPSMLASFKARQRSRAPQKASLSRCPDQLYVFLLREPCQDDLLLLEEALARLLTVEDCSGRTNVVVGYSKSVPQDTC